MALKGFCKKLFGPIVYLNLIAMAIVSVALCIGLHMWMVRYTMHGEGVDVPNVKGMTIGDATYALDQLELVTVVMDSAYVREQPVGIVLEQKPSSGCRVKSGREIYLTINQRQSPTNTIPDIAGNCSRREAEARLRALGFKIGPMEFVSGDPDWVIALKVNGREVYTGERVPCDVPVVLVIGKSDIENEESNEEIGGAWGDGTTDEAQEEYEEEL